MRDKPIRAFSADDEKTVADEIATLVAECLKRENERMRERLVLQSKISKRPVIYNCGISELPPNIVKGGALEMLRFTCTALFPIVTESDFDRLPYDEIIARLKKRIDFGDGLLETMKAQYADLKTDIAATRSQAQAGHIAAETLAYEMKGWREWIELCVRNGGVSADQQQANVPEVFDAVRDEIYSLWERFNEDPADCEMPDGKLRKPGGKRTYAECVEQHGADVIYTSQITGRKYFLCEYCRNGEDLERIIHAAKMAEKRAKAKQVSHNCRTRKREK